MEEEEGPTLKIHAVSHRMKCAKSRKGEKVTESIVSKHLRALLLSCHILVIAQIQMTFTDTYSKQTLDT